jgi:hypothetical protein
MTSLSKASRFFRLAFFVYRLSVGMLSAQTRCLKNSVRMWLLARRLRRLRRLPAALWSRHFWDSQLYRALSAGSLAGGDQT